MLCCKEISQGFQTNKIKCGKAIGGEKESVEYQKIAKYKFEKLRRIINY